MRRALAMLGVALTGVAFVLTACSPPAVHGRVLGKAYQPAHTTWSTQTATRRVCTTAGGRKTTRRSCSQIPTGMRRVAHHTAACWQLQLDSGRFICVTASRWQHIHVGDRI